MDLALSEEQEQLKAATRRLLESVCTKAWLDGVEAREEYPFELHQRMAELGLFGIGKWAFPRQLISLRCRRQNSSFDTERPTVTVGISSRRST
jgi:hypothetical protein